jgi:hypothetical protein
MELEQHQTGGRCPRCGAPLSDPQRCSSCAWDALAPVPVTAEQIMQARRHETEKELGLQPGALDRLDNAAKEGGEKDSPVPVEVAASVELPGTNEEAL